MTSTLSETPTNLDYKVVIRLKATGNAPILKQQVFKLSSKNLFQKVVLFIRKALDLSDSDSLYCYINSSFIPSNEDLIGDLDHLFGMENAQGLIVNYSLNPAWG